MAQEPLSEQAVASLRLHEMAHSLGVTAALVAAAKLGIADAIAEEPVHADDLAKRVQAHPEALRQLMRALVTRGVFEEVSDHVYGHTPLSVALRADTPGSRRPWVLLAGAAFSWQVWSKLDDAVRTGASVFPDLYGKDMFAHLSEDEPELSALFDRAAATSTAAIAEALAAALHLGSATTVADIGGGQGKLVRALLERHPDLRAVLFDTPRVLIDVDPALCGNGALAGRCSIVAGDVWQEVPVRADVYVIKGVLHMWNDDQAAAALSSIRRSAPPGARIMVIEQLVGASSAPGITTIIDLLMLATQGGKERTAREFRALFERAGLEFAGTTPTGPMNHLIEAVVPAHD
ncbi:methyltransferase [Micromonospora sp. NPDC050200]|uniref:methyltransferase n=1 Tax=Micromonospora sp. NPDC050200 TaxID=3155664 RepID=UPI0034034A59